MIGCISTFWLGLVSTFSSSFLAWKSFPRSFRPRRSVFSSAVFGESLSFLKSAEGVLSSVFVRELGS